MTLDRLTPAQLIEIKAPRWKDKSILIADWKVGNHNEIVIKATNKDGERYYPQPFYMSGEQIKKYPKQPHSIGEVYIVPLSDMQILERRDGESNYFRR